MIYKVLSIGYLFISMTLFMRSYSHAQSKFYFPMKPGTVRVYDWLDEPADPFFPKDSGILVQLTLNALPSKGVSTDTKDTVQLFSFHSSISTESCLLYVSERDFLVEDYLRGKGEIFPLLPFGKDTTIDIPFYFAWSDTAFIPISFSQQESRTIFGRDLRSFQLRVGTLWWGSILAHDHADVVDSIGISKSYTYYDFGVTTYTLSSAFIDGSEYNVQRITRDFMPLCSTNVYQFKRRLTDPSRDSIFTIRVSDTLIGNRHYSHLSDGIVPNGWSPALRESSIGLHFYIDGKDSLVLPWTVAVGTQVGRGVVTSISDTVVGGSVLKKITVQQFSEDVYDMISWIESIGIVSRLRSSVGNNVIPDTLVYANICGREFGTLVGIETRILDVTPTPILYQNVPNPFSLSSIIRYETGVKHHVRLDVFDLLGRRVATLVDRVEAPGDYTVRFDNSMRLNPGMYFYRLQINGNVLSRKMVIAH